MRYILIVLLSTLTGCASTHGTMSESQFENGSYEAFGHVIKDSVRRAFERNPMIPADGGMW